MRLTMFACVVAMAVPAIAEGQRRVSDCYPLSGAAKKACYDEVGGWERRQPIPSTIFQGNRQREFGDAQRVFDALQNGWRFARVLHGHDLQAPLVTGTFTFGPDGRYAFKASLRGSLIVEEVGVYRISPARRGEFPMLSLTATAARVGHETLANAITAAGLVNGGQTDFYIAIANDQSATLYTNGCPAGCSSYYTRLAR